MSKRTTDELRDDLVEATEFEARSLPPYERVRDALHELEIHRETVKETERDLGRVCECGHARGDHLLGRGACLGDGEEHHDEDGETIESCDCGVFRRQENTEGDHDFEAIIESADGLVTVRVRCAVGASLDQYQAARGVAEFASIAFNGPPLGRPGSESLLQHARAVSRTAETMVPDGKKRGG